AVLNVPPRTGRFHDRRANKKARRRFDILRWRVQAWFSWVRTPLACCRYFRYARLWRAVVIFVRTPPACLSFVFWPAIPKSHHSIHHAGGVLTQSLSCTTPFPVLRFLAETGVNWIVFNV